MSSIASLQLKVPVAGQTIYVSPITDLLRMNSLAYSAFFSHASLLISNMKLLFSTDGIDFTEYKTITMDKDVRITGNELIPSRYFKFEIENPDINAMSAIDVFFTAFVNVTSNIDVNLTTADAITIPGVAQESTQLLVKNAVVSTNGKITACDTGAVVVSGSALPTGASTASKQTDIENKLIQIDNVLDDMKLDTANITTCDTGAVVVSGSALPTGASTEAKQDDIATKLTEIDNVLDNIKTDTGSLDSKITKGIDATLSGAQQVLLYGRTNAGQLNALKTDGSGKIDVNTEIDLNQVNSTLTNRTAMSNVAINGYVDAVTPYFRNLQLTATENRLMVSDSDLNVGINKDRTTDSIYTNAAVSVGDVSSTINLNDGKDRYSQIQVIGSSTTNGFDFVLEYSINGSTWYSDGIVSTHYHNGSIFEFSVSRINISVPFVRVKTTTTGAAVYMDYALTK